MAAAISLLLCSLGFYVPAVVSDSPALTFHNRFFFFESFHESRTTPSESIEVKWYYVVASLKLSKTFTTKLSAKLSTKLSTKWSLKLFMKLSQNLPSKLYTKLSSKGTQEILPFQRVVWSYSLMAAASSLLCSLGFYVAHCCFRFSCAYFSQQIFFSKAFTRVGQLRPRV